MFDKNRNISQPASGVVTFLLAAGVFAVTSASACSPAPEKTETAEPAPVAGTADATPPKLPYGGYLSAHKDIAQPPRLLGGPIEVTLTQDAGGVHVSMPDRRKLDPYVFGTDAAPRAFAGSPVISGLPTMARESSADGTALAKPMSPFGDKAIVMGGAHLRLHAVDATAVDGAMTEDKVQFQASWKDKDGNTYEVRCCGMVVPHGLEFPTFGGVVTNHILHGSSRIGTPLMPTEYTYLAFWGMGEVRKNGEVLQKPRLVHGMLTEYVRGEGYALDSDEQVTPGRMHFHLMVPPMMPDMKTGKFAKNPVKTGLTLPNGMELPFWHVMFGNVSVGADRASSGGS